MTRAELWLWPSCQQEIWVEVVKGCHRAGQPIQTADAWIASTAEQWQLPLVTIDFRDYEPVADLEIVPMGSQT
jgi:predicted nucleic acid-binding protein